MEAILGFICMALLVYVVVDSIGSYRFRKYLEDKIKDNK